MLLSRASSSFFDDDDDHGQSRPIPTANQRGEEHNAAAAMHHSDSHNRYNEDTNSEHRQEESDNIKEEARADNNTATHTIENEKDEQRHARSMHDSFWQYRGVKAELSTSTDSENAEGTKTKEANKQRESNISIINASCRSTNGSEYKRNTELMSVDYELLPYVDFLDRVEKEFPAVANTSDNVDFTSCEVLAQAVMKKVQYLNHYLYLQMEEDVLIYLFVTYLYRLFSSSMISSSAPASC